MIILREIQLINFLSHAKTKIEFDPVQKLLIDGKSGSGKSSIVESLIWALYGKGRSDNRSLVKRGKKKATVVVILQDNETKHSYKIERSITDKNKHDLSVYECDEGQEFKPSKTLGVRGAQEYIENDILHSSYVLFINSIVYPQENVENFVRQPANKRKDIILEIIKASDYDDYLKKAKEALKENEKDKEVIETQISDKTNQINADRANAERVDEFAKEASVLSENIKKNKEARDKAIAEKEEIIKQQATLKTKQETMEFNLKEYDKKSARLQELNEELIQLNSVDTKSLEEKVLELKKKEGELESFNKAKEKEIEWQDKNYKIMADKPTGRDFDKEKEQINQDLIGIIGEETPECPKCGYTNPILKENKEKRVRVLEDKLKAVQDDSVAFESELQTFNTRIDEIGPRPELPLTDMELQTLKANIEELKEAEKALGKIQNKDSKEKEIATEMELIKAEQEDIKDKVKEVEEELIGLNELNDKQNSIINQISICNDEEISLDLKYTTASQALALAKEAENRIGKNEDEIKELKEKLQKISDNLEGLELVKEAFGPNGIRAIVIDYIIPQLEDKINNILSQLSDFRIKLETQKSGLSKDKILEGLFITIINEQGEEFDFDNYSGGERLKIIVAISEALAEIQKIGFRILDELFIGLDEESTESFTQVMVSLQERFSQMFCISHLRTIKDLFDQKLLITKTNGDSEVSLDN